MRAFESKWWPDYENSQMPDQSTDKTDKRASENSQTPNQATDKTDEIGSIGADSPFRDILEVGGKREVRYERLKSTGLCDHCKYLENRGVRVLACSECDVLKEDC